MNAYETESDRIYWVIIPIAACFIVLIFSDNANGVAFVLGVFSGIMLFISGILTLIIFWHADGMERLIRIFIQNPNSTNTKILATILLILGPALLVLLLILLGILVIAPILLILKVAEPFEAAAILSFWMGLAIGLFSFLEFGNN